MTESGYKPVYLIFGSDGFKRDEAYREVLREVIADADPQTCLSPFDSSAELSDVLDELRTMPFLAPCRAVIMRDADAFVSANREQIENYLNKPSETASLVLITDSWKTNTRVHKLIVKIGKIFDCNVNEKEDLGKWLVAAAARRSKKIHPQAVMLLQQWTDRDLASLDSEIEKLSLYIDDRDTITVQDVSAVVSDSAGPAAFALTNALTNMNTSEALKALNKMLSTPNAELQTLGQIAWHVRTLIADKMITDSGQPITRWIPSQRKAAVTKLLRSFPLSKFQRDMQNIVKTDLAMKSGTKSRSALQDLVVSITLGNS